MDPINPTNPINPINKRERTNHKVKNKDPNPLPGVASLPFTK